ncbi:hypothetical protein ACFOHT_04145 [Massilia oculi]|uniref:hypothetical protein n=1 Tax=Massilia oculi TaxID=945844 RepID=UPI0013B3AB33|nr:hypothetical protein [Massilia oculi]
MHSYHINNMVDGVVGGTNATKQIIGQRLASHLSFIPGPRGKDGSVDGAITDSKDVLIAHFQSKLSADLIGVDEAKMLHSDLLRLKPKLCIYIAGIGYQDSFARLLRGQPELSSTDIHLLDLNDVFSQTAAYLAALAVIPTHQGGTINFSRFLV